MAKPKESPLDPLSAKLRRTLTDAMQAHFDVRRLFPEVSLPEVLTDENLAEFGFATVLEPTPPTYDPEQASLAEGPVVVANGVWTLTWQLVPLSPEALRSIALGKVQALEAQQARAIREAVLTGDKTRLAALEKQIAELMGRNPVA